MSPLASRRSDAGFSLLEMMVALTLLAVVSAGVLPLAIVATTASENQGHLSSRAAEYAQDKLEQLMALSFNDSISDTRVFPAEDTGGTGLTVGGSIDPASPVAKYVDYLDAQGALIPSATGAPPTGWYYQRLWQVSVPAGRTKLKQITVRATVRNGFGNSPLRPRATLTTLKTEPF